MAKRKHKLFTLQMERTLFKRLKRLAKLDGVSVADVLRFALKEFLKRQRKP